MASVSTPGEGDSPEVVAEKLVHALSHPLRIRLLQLLEEEAASPAMLRDQVDPEISLSGVSYHLGVLYDSGCLEQADGDPRPGADERFFCAKPEVFVDPLYRAHARLTDPEDAISANWSGIVVDRFGWDQVVDVLRSARLQLAAIEEQSKGRLATLEQGGTPLVVGVVAFESPGNS
jgi:DNA-binding transcriptional ArsR family regulator